MKELKFLFNAFVFTLIVSLAFPNLTYSQSKVYTTKQWDSISNSHEKTIYFLLQESWIANKEASYVSLFPNTSTIGKRRIPLRQGEGVNSDFDLLEANLDLRFPLFLGKQKGSAFKRSQRITLDYNGNFRMTLDDSKPIVPSSHRVGFSWYVSLFNNYNGWISPKNDPQSETLISSKSKNFKFLNMLFRVHHYSNGQAPGFTYVPDSSNPIFFRNSYLDGDFSTNYFYLEFTGGVFGRDIGSLHQMSIGYRRDIGTDDSTFAYTVNQEKSYGRDRLLVKYDYRTKRLKKRYEYHARIELTHILGNLDNFIPNLDNDNNEYRTGIKGIIELAPKNHRSVGYFVSAYYGRDYLNIRYDDIVYSIQGGITVALDKFYIPKLQ